MYHSNVRNLEYVTLEDQTFEDACDHAQRTNPMTGGHNACVQKDQLTWDVKKDQSYEDTMYVYK